VKRKQPARETPAIQPVHSRESSWGNYLIPGAIVGLVALFVVGVAYPRQADEKQMNLVEFGKILVVDRGRVKPIDTFARTQLMLISHRQDYRDEADKTHSAVEWLLNSSSLGVYLLNREQDVEVSDPEVVKWLGLEARPTQRYQTDEILDALQTRREKLSEITRLNPDQWQPWQRNLLDLGQTVLTRNASLEKISDNLKKRGNPEDLKIFRIEDDQILALLGFRTREGLRYSLAELRKSDGKSTGMEKLVKAAQAAKSRQPKDRNAFDVHVLELADHLGTQFALSQLDGVLMVPDVHGTEKWKTLQEALTRGESRDNPNVRSLYDIFWSYAVGDVESFNKAVKNYRTVQAEQFPSESRKASWEQWFNQFAPFYWCIGLYVLVLMLAVLSWVAYLSWPGLYRPLRWSAFGVALLTVLVHTAALIIRMGLQDRPPVTNLYSSAVFIGWGCVLLCLFIEVVYRNALSLAVAGATAFPTMIIAHHLSLGGDTLEMMQAVLDTNFWLATHVVCVTLGYTATFVAGFFGIVYVMAGVISSIADALGATYRVFTKDLAKALGQIIYGVVCFATLLSFVGTVLGGIWADQSWGRFWGWDPKENGAVLIVIMNALILHARWAGMVKDRGMALLALVGNMITAWSWFGTNQLGVGLHAYGFNNTLATGCTLFWASQLGLLILGLAPLPAWQKGYTDLAPSAPPNPEPRRDPRPRPGVDPTGIVPG
jgi:ABC-type transport system involved in cytochrome c biogenesis permease subunit